MPRLLPLAALAFLSGCSSEPSFDERYEGAEKTIRDTAATMDAEMAEQERLRAVAERAAAPVATAIATASPGR